MARSLGAKVIREDVRGYGRAYKTGFASATGDIIVTLDGDHSYPLRMLYFVPVGSFSSSERRFSERLAAPCSAIRRR